MRRIKDIRENYNLVTEKEQSDMSKLTSLVRAGLFDAKKINIVKRALEKNPAEMTIAERKILLSLLDSLMSEVINSNEVYNKVKTNVSKSKNNLSEAKTEFLSKFDSRPGAKYPSESDIPVVLILKRKAIRVYPDRQKVALYYAQAIDKYVSVPFGEINIGVMNEDIGKPYNKSKDDEEDRPKRSYFRNRSYKELSRIPFRDRARETSLVNLDPKKIDPGQGGGNKERRNKILRKAVRGSAAGVALDAASQGDWNMAGAGLGYVAGSALRSLGKKVINSFKSKTASPTASKPKSSSVVPKVSSKSVAPVASSSSSSIGPWSKVKAKSNNDQPSGNFKFADSAVSKKLKTFTATDTLTAANAKKPKKAGPEMVRKRYGFDGKAPGTGPQPEVKSTKIKDAFAKKLSESRNLAELYDEKKARAKKKKLGLPSDDVIDMGLDLIPGVSNIKSGLSAINNFKKGNYGTAAIDGALAIPGIGNVGKAFKTAFRASEKIKNKYTARTKGFKGADVPKVKPTEVKPTKIPEAPKKAPEVKPVEVPKKAPEVKPVEVPKKAPDKAPEVKPSQPQKAPKPAKAPDVKPSTQTQTKTDTAPSPKSSVPTTKGARPSDRPTRKADKLDKLDDLAAVGGGIFGRGSSEPIQRRFTKPGDFGLKPTLVAPMSTDPNKVRRERERQAMFREQQEESRSKITHKFLTPKKFSLKASTTKSKSNNISNLVRQERERQKTFQQNESNLSKLKQIKESGIDEQIISLSDGTVIINNIIAEKIIQIYESVNNENKKKIDAMLNEDVASFKKIVKFAVRQ